MGHKTVINPPRTQWHLGIIGNLRIWSSTSSRRSRWLQQVAVEPSSFAERGAPWMSWDGDRGLMMIDGGKEQPSRRTSITEEEWKDMIFQCQWLNRYKQIKSDQFRCENQDSKEGTANTHRLASFWARLIGGLLQLRTNSGSRTLSGSLIDLLTRPVGQASSDVVVTRLPLGVVFNSYHSYQWLKMDTWH